MVLLIGKVPLMTVNFVRTVTVVAFLTKLKGQLQQGYVVTIFNLYKQNAVHYVVV